ncbi:MAG: hypothetical protein GXY58_06150 [Planctomycetaceae bacterium]|nr:hypothetical protein [Planctomycetaceae bacterium]
MLHRKYATHVFLVLVVCGTAGVALRYRARHDLQHGLDDTAWRLMYFIEGEARRAAADLRAAAPADTAHCRVFRQDFRQENLRINPRGRSSAQGWEVVARAERPGRCQMTLRFDLRLNPRASWLTHELRGTLTADQRAMWLRATPEIQVHHPVVSEILTAARDGGASQSGLAQRLYQFCRAQLATEDVEAADDAATVLAEGRGTPLGCARALLALCRAAKIPARPVAGFIVTAGDDAAAHVWVEVFQEERWVPYDPVNGYEEELPSNFVPARRGDDQIVMARGVRNLRVEYDIDPLPRGVLEITAAGRSPADILDLTRLPLEMQRVLALILLMPFGALVTCLFRNIVGLRTSGTFTPTLLALCFVFADWKTGCIILVAAFLLGIVTRYLIDGLKLLILPRLSIMLTLVVFCMVFGVSALEYFRIAPETQAVLLPMAILTMLVERFYMTSQEDGARVALQHLAGTLAVGFCCYLVLCWEAVAQWILAYPEAHCFTVALLVLIGRYTGYQLLEPWRFRDLANERAA